MSQETFLLDTCALFALADMSSKKLLSGTVDRLATAQKVYISAISLYEIGIKWRQGKLPAIADPKNFWDFFTTELQCDEVSISANDLNQAFRFPDYHRDPFDRIIAAQGMLLDVTAIVTCDQQLANYPSSILW